MCDANADSMRRTRLQSLLDALKEDGLRLTPQRIAIVRALVNHTGHPSVEDLYNLLLDDFPTMSLATVYKTISLLKEKHQALELEFSSRDNRFDGLNPDPHPHLICTRCGRITDYFIPGFESIVNDLSERTGYRVESHRLDFYGLCPDCTAQKV